MQTRNIIKILIIFLKNIKFDIIIKYIINKYFQVSCKLISLKIYN